LYPFQLKLPPLFIKLWYFGNQFAHLTIIQPFQIESLD